MTTLTEQLLAIVYHDTATRRPWRDQLSDWLLDRYQRRHTVGARDILDGLFLFRTDLLERILRRPDLHDQLAALLTPADTPSHPTASQKTPQ